MERLASNLGKLAAVSALSLVAGLAAAQTDVLPDITTDAATLSDWDIITSSGQRLLRLANATPNKGLGRLHLYGSTVNTNGTQDVVQRVFRSDGTWWDRLAGQFTYHPTHGHIHYDNWCQYRLRVVLPGGGVGAVVAQGAKVSFCILDLAIDNSSNPGFVNPGFYSGCGSVVQGLTPGWKDIYGKTLAGQNINITGVASGIYWLESEVDPLNNVLEANETNNISRIQVTIPDTGGSTILPDAYEPNDSRAQVDARPAGAPNSPNLGPTFPSRTIDGTTIHTGGNEDFYKFYMAGTGAAGDKVRVEFSHAAGDVDIQLQSSTGAALGSSTGTGNSEEVSLSGRAKGWYFLRVYGFSSATSPSVRVIVDPAASAQAPTIGVTAPPVGDVRRVIGLENYTVTWNSNDPDADPTWVTIYVNTTPTLNGSQILIPDTINTNGAFGSAIINSAYLTPGTYWVYAQITDGGSTVGAWSPGTVTFVAQCVADRNLDGEVDFSDIEIYLAQYTAGLLIADINNDGEIDFSDIESFIAFYNAGCGG